MLRSAHARRGIQVSAEEHAAGAGVHHTPRLYAGRLLGELLDAARCAVHIRTAPRGLLRCGLNRGRKAGGRAPQDGRGVDNGGRNDRRQPLRSAFGNGFKLNAIMAFPLRSGDVRQPDSALLHLEMGAGRGRSARQRLPPPVRFPEEGRAVAHPCGDDACQRRHLLLVQLHQSAANRRRFRCRHAACADDSGRLRHGGRQPD